MDGMPSPDPYTNPYAEILASLSPMMVLDSRTLGGGLVNGISVLIKQTLESVLALIPLCEDTVNMLDPILFRLNPDIRGITQVCAEIAT